MSDEAPTKPPRPQPPTRRHRIAQHHDERHRCYRTRQPTPEGVSRATTRTVVVASLAVLALDFVLTAMMFSI